MPETPPPKSAGRPGLQRKDVADAIDTLIKRGIRDPSLTQLRQHLGRGSNSTISRLRNEIRGERLLTTRTPVEGSVESAVLPALVKAMEQLGEEAARAADDQVTQMRSTFEAAQSTLSRERDEADGAAHDSRIELATRAEQVKDLRETIKALRAEAADERKRLDRAEAERRKFEDRTHALSTDVTRLKDERDQLEKVLSDKTSALEAEGAARQTLQGELTALTETNRDLISQLAIQTGVAETCQQQAEILRESQTAIEQRALEAEQGRASAEATAAARIAGLEARLDDSQKVVGTLIEKIDGPG